LNFLNTSIRHYIEPYIHVNYSELITNLNTAVVGKFISRQTASEKNPYATPNEWERICQEEHDAQMNQLLLEEQKLEMQSEINVATQEQLSDIQTEQTIAVSNAEKDETSETKSAGRAKSKHSVATGRGRKRGRPDMLSKRFDANGNEIDETTGKAKSKWDDYNKTH